MLFRSGGFSPPPLAFYTGAAPNQQAIPAVEYLMSEDGGSAKRFVLLGTDYQRNSKIFEKAL